MTVEYTLLALAVPALLAAAGFAVWTRLRTRRMLDTLGKMLDDAIRGEFRESLYDESRLSALETRMAHYLSASAVSAKNLAEEKDAIKTLIGDISHQTKTPIANLLLYAQLLEEQDLPPESREYASALEHQAEKLRFLIDALVKTSRLESGVLAMTPKRHGIQQLLDAASAQAAPGAEAKAITLTVEPTDLTARFDPKWTKDLRKVYGSGDTEVRALDGVDLTVEKGEFVAVVGTSGSGKSTLLHMLGGLDRPTGGTVTVGGKELSAMRDEELTIFRRRKIGFVFQNYNLVPVLNVYENIVLPIQLDGNAPDKAYVERIIETLGLEAKLQNLPNNLSGGQQQRVAIARALAAKPAIILADEPTGNLDSATSLDVMGLLKVTAQKFSQTIVMITHNEELAQMADRIIRIEDGRIVVRG